MNVSLTPELEQFVQSRVASGRFQTASEVVREGLRLLEERELAREIALKELRSKIRRASEQDDRGEFLDGDVVFEQMGRFGAPATPEPEVLGVLGEESRRKGTDRLTPVQIAKVITAVRSRRPKRP
jgi:antitoxin ParD1/3/4